MIYKFRSSATGDVIMLGPQGDQLLGLIGKSPAAQGIIEPAAMAAAIAALQASIASAEAPTDDVDKPDADRDVSLRQRVWPMVEMLRRAQAADAAVTWGV